jgi:hypothetical protein
MRLDAPRILLGMTFVATTSMVALLSDVGLARLSQQFPGLDCVRELVGVSCQLAPPVEDSKVTELAFMLLGLMTYVWFRFRASASNYAPFAMFLSGLLVVCTAFDLVFGFEAYNMSKVYSSTVNTFSYILMFTFLVMVLIKDYDPVAFMVSVAGSFTVKVLAFTALGLLLPAMPGATGMFALFVTYSFAAFGIHLMMACKLFVSSR